LLSFAAICTSFNVLIFFSFHALKRIESSFVSYRLNITFTFCLICLPLIYPEFLDFEHLRSIMGRFSLRMVQGILDRNAFGFHLISPYLKQKVVSEIFRKVFCLVISDNERESSFMYR